MYPFPVRPRDMDLRDLMIGIPKKGKSIVFDSAAPEHILGEAMDIRDVSHEPPGHFYHVDTLIEELAAAGYLLVEPPFFLVVLASAEAVSCTDEHEVSDLAGRETFLRLGIRRMIAMIEPRHIDDSLLGCESDDIRNLFRGNASRLLGEDRLPRFDAPSRDRREFRMRPRDDRGVDIARKGFPPVSDVCGRTYSGSFLRLRFIDIGDSGDRNRGIPRKRTGPFFPYTPCPDKRDSHRPILLYSMPAARMSPSFGISMFCASKRNGVFMLDAIFLKSNSRSARSGTRTSTPSAPCAASYGSLKNGADVAAATSSALASGS